MTKLTHELESPREVADRLGWPLARVRKLIRGRELRHVKVGGLYLIPVGAVEDYISTRTVEPDSAQRGEAK